MSKKRKIFVEATPLINKNLSGVGQVTLETLRALDSSKYKDDYDIRAFVPMDEKSKMQKYNFENVTVVTLPFPHKVLSLFSRMSMALPLDTLLGRGTYVFPNFRNWNLATSKSITYIHDVCFAMHPEYIEPRNLNFLRKYINLWTGRTDRIVTVSKTCKQEIIKHLGVQAKSVEVIQNTIDGNFYSPQSVKNVESIKSKYGLGAYFLYVGNIEPRKNLLTLIEAFEKSQLKNVTLFIVGGDGWLNEEVYSRIQQAKQKGIDIRKNESYIPNDEMPALFTGANALVLPSWHEGFGLTPLQAISCGTKAICADIPVLREVAAEHKGKVDFFPPESTTKLANLLKKYGQVEKAPVQPAIIERTWVDAADELLTLAAKLERKK